MRLRDLSYNLSHNLHKTARDCILLPKWGYISTDLRRIKEEHSDALLVQTKSWIKGFRRAVKVSVGTGWTVQPDRGNIRVLYGTKATRFLSINLPYKWQEDQWVEALKLIETAADTYENHKSKISFSSTNYTNYIIEANRDICK